LTIIPYSTNIIGQAFTANQPYYFSFGFQSNTSFSPINPITTAQYPIAFMVPYTGTISNLYAAISISGYTSGTLNGEGYTPYGGTGTIVATVYTGNYYTYYEASNLATTITIIPGNLSQATGFYQSSNTSVILNVYPGDYIAMVYELNLSVSGASGDAGYSIFVNGALTFNASL
jgi:hypothetical protein